MLSKRAAKVRQEKIMCNVTFMLNIPAAQEAPNNTELEKILGKVGLSTWGNFGQA